MVRAPFPHLVALLCGIALSVAVAGCGSDNSNLIPSGDASSLKGQLADIKSQIDAGQCDGLADKVKAFHDDATSLDSAVDKRLRTRLRQGANSLQAHAVTDCQNAAAAKAQTQTTDTTTTDTTTQTVPTETTTVPTTTTPPADTTPTDTTTTPPPTDTTTAPTDTTTSPSGGTDNGGTSGEGLTP